MKKKNLRAWVQANRLEIDIAIVRAGSRVSIDDHERMMWVMNDEGLYSWARSEGVNV